MKEKRVLDKEKQRCSCGKVISIGRGYSNRMTHIINSHKDYEHRYELHLGAMEEGVIPMSNILPFDDDKSTNMYNWIDWIIDSNLSLNFVEHESTKRNTILKSITRKTLSEAIEKLSGLVVKKIKNELDQTNAIGIILDGWNHLTVDYISLRCSYSVCVNDVNYIRTPLLAFAPLLDETFYGAQNHVEFIEETLVNYYGKSVNDIVYIGGDNEATNPDIADILGVAFNGCKSHLFNLACNDFIRPYEKLIDKVNTIMTRLTNRISAGYLREYQRNHNLKSLSAVKKNDTRWSSIYYMLKRYLEFLPYLDRLNSKAGVVELLLKRQQNNALAELFELLQFWETFTKALQSNDCSNVMARGYFDAIIEKFDNFEYPFINTENYNAKKYLAADAEIIHNSIWNNAIIKVQNGQEHLLTYAEASSIQVLIKAKDLESEENSDDEESNDSYNDSPEPDSPATLLRKVNEKLKKQKVDTNNGS
eukprot:gene20680-26812_t